MTDKIPYINYCYVDTLVQHIKSKEIKFFIDVNYQFKKLV